MDANKAAGSEAGAHTIITLSVPADAAAKMLEPDFIERLKEQLSAAELPKNASITRGDPDNSANTAS